MDNPFVSIDDFCLPAPHSPPFHLTPYYIIFFSFLSPTDYHPTQVGCTPPTNLSTSCCSLASSCASTTTQGQCTASPCAAGFNSYVVSGTTKTVCLSKGRENQDEIGIESIHQNITGWDLLWVETRLGMREGWKKKCTKRKRKQIWRDIVCSEYFINLLLSINRATQCTLLNLIFWF